MQGGSKKKQRTVGNWEQIWKSMCQVQIKSLKRMRAVLKGMSFARLKCQSVWQLCAAPKKLRRPKHWRNTWRKGCSSTWKAHWKNWIVSFEKAFNRVLAKKFQRAGPRAYLLEGLMALNCFKWTHVWLSIIWLSWRMCSFTKFLKLYWQLKEPDLELTNSVGT